jgi:peptidoglycan hydrolase-like protein with peptidoglycan-binding domain
MPARRFSVLRAFIVVIGALAISIATMGAASPTVHVRPAAAGNNPPNPLPWPTAEPLNPLTDWLAGDATKPAGDAGPAGEPAGDAGPSRQEIIDRRALERASRSVTVSQRVAPVRSYQPRARLPLMRGHRDSRRGSLVTRVQRRLGISADGNYGNTTEFAVKRFQAVHDARGYRVPRGTGLPITGVVNKTTLRAIRSSLQRSGEWLTARRIARAAGASPRAVSANWPLIDWVLRSERMTAVGSKIAVVATIVTEVGSGFRPINEYGSRAYFRSMYEGRRDLGNIRRGDGARFHGRGYIQLTGRANYRTYGRRLGYPLVRRPAMALRPRVGAAVLVDYFQRRAIPGDARRARWRMTRLKVNGGYNGWSEYRRTVSRLLRASMR